MNGYDGITYTLLDSFNRTRAVRTLIRPGAMNTVNNTYFVYLGTHEMGHPFNLMDCLGENLCTTGPGNSIMNGWAYRVF